VVLLSLFTLYVLPTSWLEMALSTRLALISHARSASDSAESMKREMLASMPLGTPPPPLPRREPSDTVSGSCFIQRLAIL
jgi:hypothetical protein